MSKHACRAVVIRCMDYRLAGPIREFLVSLGLKDQYDEVSVAGATKGLSNEILTQQVATAKKLHGISDVYIIHHTDCGAYGGREAFSDEQAERTKQIEDMHHAVATLQKTLPDLAYNLVLARVSEKDQVDFEMIN